MMYLGSDPVGITREGLANDISIIDDTAGEGDTLKVWSADKTSELETEMGMLVEKRIVPPPAPVEITQMCDLSNATKNQYVTNGKYYYHNAKITFVNNGFYYMNPTGIGVYLTNYEAFNSSGQEIQIYRNGSAVGAITSTPEDGYIERVNSREFKVYFSDGSLNWTYTADEDVVYLNGDCSIGDGTDQLAGVTFGGESSTYVPISETPDVDPEYEYVYKDDVGDFVFEHIMGEYVDEAPTEKSNNLITSGGIATAINEKFEDSYNLIDESKFDWTPVGGYWYLEGGYYFKVTEGKKLCCNVAKYTFQFYDSTKTLLSSQTAVNKYTLVDIPQDAAWARMYINASSNVLTDIKGKILVYESDSTTSSNDDYRQYVPHKKIKGNLVEGDIYETARPQSLNSDLLLASQYKAIRAVNHRMNAFRIGTFNIYLPRTTDGWALLKEELKTYSIDMCAFQEVNNDESRNRVLQNYLTMNNWQFAYASQPMFDNEYSQKAVVSAYQIVSTSHYVTSTDRDYIKCVINLPQYKHYDHQFTLSLYSYHGISSSSTLRLQEVEEILQTISNDTSDFIVVCGDTNAFEEDAQGKRATWEAWIDGGFTPIHYGECQTVTFDGYSIDQIFMGKNISCLFYDIADSNKWTININGTPVPISDHDFVYADLQFDFDAVLASLNEEET